jgi:hypothetical protein
VPKEPQVKNLRLRLTSRSPRHLRRPRRIKSDRLHADARLHERRDDRAERRPCGIDRKYHPIRLLTLARSEKTPDDAGRPGRRSSADQGMPPRPPGGEGGRIGRVDIMTEAARTADGFGVGTQASAIRTRFGDQMGMATNALEPEITDLIVVEGNTKIVFEIQDGVVRSWRAGVAPTIDYVAHCG